MSFSTTPKTPSTPNPARLLELTATDPYEDGVEDLLKLSIVPDAAHDAFRATVDSVDAFLSCDEAAIALLVDELAAAHQPLATSPFKRRILQNNLLTLVEFKRAGGSVRAGPTILEQRAFVDAALSPLSSTFQQSLLSATLPPVVPPAPHDHMMANGSKLGDAIPKFNGERADWFDWKEMVEIKIGQFPAFRKVFAGEAEALRDTVMSDVLYSVFQERTLGGAAQTLVQSAMPKTGFHAFKALTEAMEDEETVDRIRKEAEKLKSMAIKDTEKSILEFRGDCQKYFKVADRVEAIEGHAALAEHKRIKHILHSISDPEFKATMLRLKEKVEEKQITTSEEVFTLLTKTETYLATANFKDDSHPVSSIRKTSGQQVPGPKDMKKVRIDEGGPATVKTSEIILPSGLYETMTPEQQVWALEWFRALKKTGDPKAAAKISKKKIVPQSSKLKGLECTC